MAMRVKREYLVLIVIIIAAVGYLSLHEQDREYYTLPQLKSVSAEDITRIDITREGSTVTLTKNGDLWKITPGGYTADGAAVKGMLFTLADLSVTALVSESKAFTRYDLGQDKRIQVVAYGSGSPLRSVDIGKSAPTFQHTFVKLPDDDRIYHAAGDFRRKFDRSVDDLRDKVVLAFQPEAIDTIIVTTPDQTVTLKRAPSLDKPGASPPEKSAPKPAAVWTVNGGKTIDDSLVAPLLARLNRLTCSRFMDNATPDGLGTPETTVALGGKKPLTLSIYPETADVTDGRPAVSSETAQPFVLSSWVVESVGEMVGKWAPKEETETPAETPDGVASDK